MHLMYGLFRGTTQNARKLWKLKLEQENLNYYPYNIYFNSLK